MGTAWEEIETAAMVYIKNDLSLDWDMKNRLSVYYNRMSLYMKAAIPKFNRPPEMLLKLSKYTLPQFADYYYEVDKNTADTITVQTGQIGFDIVSAGVIGTDEYENPSYTPLTVTEYDAETGNVTVVENVFAAGVTIEFDFYTSGSFDETLNDTEADILAFAIYDVWEHRFDNNALERSSKLRDSTFTTISEASQTNAGTSRQKEVDAQLYGMMRAYQDNLAYLKYVKNM